jgi:hypothetical protein
MLIHITGTFHNIDGGVRPGDVVDVDDQSGINYCMSGYAEPVTKTAEKAVAREERVVEKVVAAEEELKGIEDVSYQHEDVPSHPVSSAALEPDAIVHDVTPDKGRVTAENPLKPERPRAAKTTTVPTKRTPRKG